MSGSIDALNGNGMSLQFEEFTRIAESSSKKSNVVRFLGTNGGIFEIQKMNTAIAGFKTGSVNSVTERLGGSAYRQFHRGGSDHVNV